MLNDKDIVLIEDYLDGDLSGDQLEDFEKRILNEPELAKELSLYEQMNERLRDHHKSRQIEEWKKIIAHSSEITKEDTPPPTFNRRRLFWILGTAAALALLLVGVFNLLSSPKTLPGLASLYWEETDSFFVTSVERGASTSTSDLSGIYSDYVSGNYEQALQALSKMESPGYELQLLSAACSFRLSQSRAAIDKLLPLTKNSKNIIKDEANWYLALAYLQDKQLAPAREILKDIVARKSWNHARARQLLDQL